MTTVVLEHLQNVNSSGPDLTIDSSGNIGIGDSNNSSYDSNAQNLLLASSGNTGMTIRSAGSTPFAMIHFADGTADNNAKRAGRIIYQHDGDNLTIHTANTERMRIDGSGRVGIGTGGTVNTNAHANADDFVIGNTSNRTGMTIVSDPAQNGNIHFSDGTSTGNADISGQLSYEHSDNSFRFYANSTTEVLRLTSSGGTVFNNGEDINQNFTVKSSGNSGALFIDGNGGNISVNRGNFSSNPTGSKLNVFGNGEVLRLDGTGNTSRTLRFRGVSSANPGIIMADGSLEIMNEDANTSLALMSERDITIKTTKSNGAAGHVKFYSYNTEIMRINGDNNTVTMPELPSFSAVYNGSTWNSGDGNTMVHNYTGAGGHNTGNNYSTSTGRFTAPVAGVYQFNWYSILNGTYNNAYIQFYKNGGRMYGGDIHLSKNAAGWDTYNWVRAIYLSAGDYIEPIQRGSLEWHGNHWNNFSGYLVG